MSWRERAGMTWSERAGASRVRQSGPSGPAVSLSPVRVLEEVLRRAVEVLRQAVSTAPETGVKTG